MKHFPFYFYLDQGNSFCGEVELVVDLNSGRIDEMYINGQDYSENEAVVDAITQLIGPNKLRTLISDAAMTYEPDGCALAKDFIEQKLERGNS